MPCYPVFCTTKIPAEVLEELVTLRRKDTAQYGTTTDDVYFITPSHDTTRLRATDTRLGPPPQDLTQIQPFHDWTVQECYSFYKTWLQAPSDQADSDFNFTAFTFLILDRETLSTGFTHHSALICTDAPDITDIPKRERTDDKTTPFLKFRRSTFWAAVQTLDVWEMMTGMFSDLGCDEQLSFHAESWFERVRNTEGGGRELRGMLTPGEARARQERLLLEYVEGRRGVDMTGPNT